MNGLTQSYDQAPHSMQQPMQGGALAQASSSREMEEVKGQIFMAKQFPRNIFQSEQRILDNCKRESLARVAVYSYPRGGTKVEGPSIRMAEVLAQNWGNLAYGIKELEQREGESVAMAYAWDLETNVRQEKVFTVKHSMKAKGKLKKLEDPRDIYELVANNGARRVRACVLGVIPGDIVDKAVEQCKLTMTGQGDKPLKERINAALKAFKDNHRVTQDMIEARIGYNADAFTEYDLMDLIQIFNSLKDGMSKPEDWFSKETQTEKEQPKTDLTKGFEEAEAAKKDDKPKSSSKKNEKAVNTNDDDLTAVEFTEDELPFK
ncbi:hypothetical protein [Geomicrobium sp. JCM 19038]|uniref:hypothetical protein n=1 Tax=Geomicrobium sp. JCM 19038 TaxID=1460635 RepID=UPI00045F328E|nr:hypothetical protein [Geomicrobium sp. JCM 19038]GAK09604.1 hypothetical protein JCM19038_3446 [Geomicrobium sp. JCM 19038]